MNPTTLYVVVANGYLTHDDKQKGSEILFNHLHSREDNYLTEGELPNLRLLAKAHGWKISVRGARAEEMEDGE